MDIITTVFRVVRNYQMDEILKLEFIKVKSASTSSLFAHVYKPPRSVQRYESYSGCCAVSAGSWVLSHEDR